MKVDAKAGPYPKRGYVKAVDRLHLGKESYDAGAVLETSCSVDPVVVFTVPPVLVVVQPGTRVAPAIP